MDAPNLWLVGGVLGLCGFKPVGGRQFFHGHVGNLQGVRPDGAATGFCRANRCLLAVTGALSEGSLEKPEPQDS